MCGRGGDSTYCTIKSKDGDILLHIPDFDIVDVYNVKVGYSNFSLDTCAKFGNAFKIGDISYQFYQDTESSDIFFLRNENNGELIGSSESYCAEDLPYDFYSLDTLAELEMVCQESDDCETCSREKCNIGG